MPVLKPVSAPAARVLNMLTDTLGSVGDSIKIDNAKGTFMAVSVERLFPHIFSVTHYYEQNGDLVPDPDMTFAKDDAGNWYPLTFRNSISRREVVPAGSLDEHGKPTRFSPASYNDLRAFTTTWMRNVASQQDLKAPRKAG